METTKDYILEWCEDNGEYLLKMRLTHLPEDCFEHIIFCTVPEANRWLDDNGY